LAEISFLGEQIPQDKRAINPLTEQKNHLRKCEETTQFVGFSHH